MDLFRRQAKILESLDKMILQKSEDVATELRTELSREARNLKFKEDAWMRVQAIIKSLKEIIGDLKSAEKGGEKGGEALIRAESLLGSLSSSISTIDSDIFAAISMDAAEEKVAKDVVKKLADAHTQLKFHAVRIRDYKWPGEK